MAGKGEPLMEEFMEDLFGLAAVCLILVIYFK
jgi:hypothetical protein